MTLDHGYKLFSIYLDPLWMNAFGISEYGSYLLNNLLFGAGSITIFIFMWFVAEGCRYTHNMKGYLLRLLLFAILSEIPFQIMIQIITVEPVGPHFALTNVMFTLALGVIACYGYQTLKNKGRKYLGFVVPVICCIVAYLLQTDYHFYGVLGIFLLYMTQDHKKRLLVLTGLVLLVIGDFTCSDILGYGFDLMMLPVYLIHLAFAFLSVPLLAAYKGNRGKKLKYFFYLYYPIHISVLVLLYLWLSSLLYY